MDGANTAYSTALALYPQLPEGWVSWGSHCDAMYQGTRNTAWLDYAITCYLQASAPGPLPHSLPSSVQDSGGLAPRCLASVGG